MGQRGISCVNYQFALHFHIVEPDTGRAVSEFEPAGFMESNVGGSIVLYEKTKLPMVGNARLDWRNA